MTRMLAPGLAALGMAAIVALTVPQAASAAEPGTSAGGDARITAASRNDRIRRIQAGRDTDNVDPYNEDPPVLAVDSRPDRSRR